MVKPVVIISWMKVSHVGVLYQSVINMYQEDGITRKSQNGDNMSEYTKVLYDKVNGNGFFRSFYGECPECEKKLFSVDDNPKGDRIVAKFICPKCNRKYKETVYSADLKKYKYMQSIVYDYKDLKKGLVKVLKIKDSMFLVTPTKILVKRGDNR